MTPKDQVAELVDRFHRNLDTYKQDTYKETRVRVEFIDPLFEALGWDVRNTSGFSEKYKDVVHEAAVNISGSARAPDYSFRVGGSPKFLLEAKKPSVAVREDVGPAYQVRRYAWNMKLPLSILTDFEEFAAYDCRTPPRLGDKASTARVLYITFEEYLDRWDEIFGIFGKESVLGGSFDKYAESISTKRGTSDVDTEFLKEIEDWRDVLARNVALRNPGISVHELNFAVQRTIDRIIFLRISEDRGIEEYGRLLALTNGTHIYERMQDLYRQADEKYNAGLFDFQADTLSKTLIIDDRVLKPILSNLYYPQSPYEFSVLPANILGQVYEQFLGRVIRLTPGHRAKVDEKPEIKKAGGVYYTPSYIVDYIVKHTVGKLLEGKTPRQISKLRIIDPACGSGSFLLGAYQQILDYHQQWYEDHDPERFASKNRPPFTRGPSGQWKLTTQEKKRILLNNIYGVDIDRQAVEVTKLSLLLNVLEGETDESIGQQLTLWKERALPDLGKNIKCGNSLISSDYFKSRLIQDNEELLRINPFDWDDEFHQIISTGGFDCLIGNPPYRRELDYKYLMDDISRTPFGKKYRVQRMDLWYYFVHRGLSLLRPNGLLGFIVNSYWTASTGARKLKKALQTEAHIDEIFYFGKLRIFDNVSGQHMILLVSKSTSNKLVTIKIAEANTQKTAEPFVDGTLKPHTFEKRPNQLFVQNRVDLQPPDGIVDKLSNWPPLNKLGIVRQGIAENPSSINKKTNSKYGDKWHVGEGVFALTKDELNNLNLPKRERALLRPYYSLSDLGRYYISPAPSLTLIYSTRDTCPDIDEYPTVRDHLAQFKPIMDARRETRKGSNSWWHLHWPRDEDLWEASKILSIQMAKRPSFVPALTPAYVSFSVNVFVPDPSIREHIYYIAGVLNSRLLWKWFQHRAKRRGAGLEINGNTLSNAPIRRIDFTVKRDEHLHDSVVTNVERILDLQRDLASSKIDADRDVLARQIDFLDNQVDEYTFELYKMSEREITSVKSTTTL